MTFTTLRLSLLALLSVGLSQAAVVYNNTTTDTLVTYFYSVGPYTQIGDTVTLAGVDRTLTDASVQFYNNGSAGTFDALLRFFAVGSPVGTQLGSDYLLTGNSIGGQDILTLNFTGLNLLVPDSLVFTIEIANATAGMDIGLNAFEPPTPPASSDNTQLIVRDATTFSVGTAAAGQGNLYLQLDATTVPEPSSIALVGAALALGLAAHKRRRA